MTLLAEPDWDMRESRQARLCPLTRSARPGPLPWDPGSVQARQRARHNPDVHDKPVLSPFSLFMSIISLKEKETCGLDEGSTNAWHGCAVHYGTIYYWEKGCANVLVRARVWES